MARPPKRDIIAAVVSLVLAAAAVVGVGVVVFGEAIWWRSSAILSSQATGDELIERIERYQTDHGVYPASLEQLTPTYIHAIERPSAGERLWRYSLQEDGNSFTLSFAYDDSNYPVCFFESQRGVWWEDR